MFLKFKAQLIALMAGLAAFGALLLRAKHQGKTQARQEAKDADQTNANSVRDRVRDVKRVRDDDSIIYRDD